ncbi:galactose mutarotase-like protein [Ramaria rubella]|nr:galactose mutarotase-like protein [Ramaria rubella]
MPLKTTNSKVTLSHPNGSSAEVLLYGATVISWKAPSQFDGGSPSERLFTSSKAFLDGSKPVRGGIPVVFPFFGPPTRPEHSHLAQHGFARSEVWKFDSTIMDNEAGVSVRFVLEPSVNVKTKFPAAFSLVYVVTLAAHQLTTGLHVTNPSTTETLTFQALLHTYIRANIALSTVTPFKGLKYINKLKPGWPVETEERQAVDVREPADYVYKSAGGDYEVTWGGGLGVEVKATGFDDVVIWNPGKEGRKMADMEEGGWDLFIAVEPGAASYWIDLAPGKSWIGQQSLTVM